jgi:hypothetical protein
MRKVFPYEPILDEPERMGVLVSLIHHMVLPSYAGLPGSPPVIALNQALLESGEGGRSPRTARLGRANANGVAVSNLVRGVDASVLDLVSQLIEVGLSVPLVCETDNPLPDRLTLEGVTSW